jgi:hypothetical protein
MPPSATRMISLNPVLAERAGDFEEFLATVVVPAAEAHRPAHAERWHVLRSRQEEDGVVVFAFLFEGDEDNDWALQPLLEEAYGADEARRSMDRLQAMLRGEQYGWPVERVDLRAVGSTAPER